MKKILISLLFVLPILVSANVSGGVDYLKNQTQGPWLTMALISAGENPDTTYLKTIDSSSVIALTAPILAMTAAGLDPRTYPDINSITKLKSYYSDGQLGDASTLNDDIFGLLALLSSGETISDPVVSGVQTMILDNQNNDGGWGFMVGGSSDTNMTSMAIMALLKSGISSSNLVEAKAYLQEAQNNDGGFPYDPLSPWGTASDASSDAWVISAIHALGEDPLNWIKDGHNPVEHLLSLQVNDNFFQYQLGSGEDSFSPITTAYAVTALGGNFYPLSVSSPEVHFRIEGSNELICEGDTLASDALSLIEIVSIECDFTYHVEELSFGPYLKKINEDEAAGLIGWLYLVNDQQPSVGAADYDLQDDDDVLWYYGDFEWNITRVILDEEDGIVEFYNGLDWDVLAGATVYAGAYSTISGDEGQFSFDLPNGAYRIFAEKDGYVRSAKHLITVGDRVESNIILHATVGDRVGPEGSETISFILDLDQFDFGLIQPGYTYTRNVRVTNNGETMHIESVVTGDSLFRSFLTINSLLWRTFSMTIQKDANEVLEVGLPVPSTYGEPGDKDGSLTLWAVWDQN